MPPSPLRLDPKIDAVFKLLLGGSESLLIALLTAVLKPEVPIQRAIVRNPGLPKDFHDDKGSFLDIAVTLDDGSTVDVEMQTSRGSAFCERTLYYWSGLFYSQLSEGDAHQLLTRVVTVLFIDYRQFAFANFHEIFHITGARAGTVFSPLLEFHTIELPKLTQELASEEPELARWCRFFSSKDPQELKALTEADPMIKHAENKLMELSADQKLREMLLDQHRRKMGALIVRNAERHEAIQEGKAEGKAEGRVEGEASAVLTFLDARGISLTSAQREQISGCTDLRQLGVWIRRAATVSDASELFA